MTGTIMEQIRNMGGVDADARRFVIRRPTCDVEVECDWSQVVLRTPFPAGEGTGAKGAYRGRRRRVVETVRPLELIPRKETGADVRNKASGVNREVQTGDASFDREVYITSHADDDVLKAVLAEAGVREAILWFLGTGMEQLTLDDAGGHVSVWYASHAQAADNATGAEILDNLEKLVAGLPALVTIGRRPSRWSWFQAVGAVALVSLPGAVAGAALIGPAPDAEPGEGARESLSSWYGATLAGGMMGGMSLGLLIGWLLGRRIRGQFHSAARRKLVMIAAIAVAVELGVIGAHLFWRSR